MSGNDPYTTPERPNTNVNVNAVLPETPETPYARTPTTVAVSPSGTDLYRGPIDDGYEQAIRDVNNGRSLFSDQASPPPAAAASPMPRFFEERDMARGGRRNRKTAGRRNRKTRGGSSRRRRKSQKKHRRKTH